jgi:phasin family protein
MPNDAMTKMTEQYQNFLAPVVKANKLSAANLESLVSFQMSALQAYVDMAIGRMKAAADINDPASLKTFLTSQAEAIAGLQQKLMEDTKTLGDMANRFKSEFDALVKESMPTYK